MDPAQALTDLTEISSQIQAAVLVDGDGTVLASTFPDAGRAERVAEASRALLRAAQEVPGEVPGESLAQLEAATAGGSVFVVRDAERMIVAITTPEPTVGLVFYDLKSCLRAVAADEGDGRPRPAARQAETGEEAEDGEEAT